MMVVRRSDHRNIETPLHLLLDDAVELGDERTNHVVENFDAPAGELRLASPGKPMKSEDQTVAIAQRRHIVADRHLAESRVALQQLRIAALDPAEGVVVQFGVLMR